MTTEIESLPVLAERLPARVSPQTDAGMAALAAMSDGEFEARLAGLKRGQDRIKRIHTELLDRDVDFGVIPNTGSKPTLLKPGAEKLLCFYGFAADFAPEITYGKDADEPAITVVTRCMVHLGDTLGPVVAIGCGAANSWEKRYRYRRGERACPQCGKEGTLLRSRNSEDWFCWAKKGGCGTTFALTDERITRQVVGDVQNEDPFDLLNTLVKIAAKRSLVDGTLRATATSALFGQDLEDLPSHLRSAPDAPQSPPEARGGRSAAGAAHAAAPTPKGPRNALQSAQRGGGAPPMEPEEEAAPLEGELAEQFTVCQADGGCGIILSDAELAGSIKRGVEFGGRFLCVAHGKQALAAWREAQAAMAALTEEGSDAGPDPHQA